jgi:O-antigen/teichoic acid export membrane protein
MLAQIQMRLQSYWDTIIMREVGDNQRAKATQTMLKSLQLGVGFILVAMVNAYLFADVFLSLWVGEKYSTLMPTLVLFIGVLLSAAVQLSTSPYFNALQLQKLNAGLGLAELVAKVLLVVPLALGFGSSGIIVSTLVAGLLVGVVARLYLLAPYTGWSLSTLVQKALQPLMPVMMGVLGLIMIYQVMQYFTSTLEAKAFVFGLELTLGIGVLMFLKYSKQQQRVLKVKYST